MTFLDSLQRKSPDWHRWNAVFEYEKIGEAKSAEVSEVLAPKCITWNEEMTKDTEGTVRIGNSNTSCDQFMASAYFENCKINIYVIKWTHWIMLSSENVLWLFIREGVNKGYLLVLVSLF